MQHTSFFAIGKIHRIGRFDWKELIGRIDWKELIGNPLERFDWKKHYRHLTLQSIINSNNLLTLLRV